MIDFKPLFIAFLALFLLSGLVMADMAPEESMSKDGAMMVEKLTKKDPYTGWKLWPGTSKLYEGTQPHGAYLTTYVNDKAYQAIENKAGALPDGAVVVKENYTQDKKLAAVTVMKKIKGYDPNHGDYYWLKYAPDGTVQAEGRVGSCISCHAKAIDNDWLFTSQVK